MTTTRLPTPGTTSRWQKGDNDEQITDPVRTRGASGSRAHADRVRRWRGGEVRLRQQADDLDDDRRSRRQPADQGGDRPVREGPPGHRRRHPDPAVGRRVDQDHHGAGQRQPAGHRRDGQHPDPVADLLRRSRRSHREQEVLRGFRGLAHRPLRSLRVRRQALRRPALRRHQGRHVQQEDVR